MKKKKKYWSHSGISPYGHNVIGIYSSNLTESEVFVNLFVLLCGIEQLIVKLWKRTLPLLLALLKAKYMDYYFFNILMYFVVDLQVELIYNIVSVWGY